MGMRRFESTKEVEDCCKVVRMKTNEVIVDFELMLANENTLTKELKREMLRCVSGYQIMQTGMNEPSANAQVILLCLFITNINELLLQRGVKGVALNCYYGLVAHHRPSE